MNLWNVAALVISLTVIQGCTGGPSDGSPSASDIEQAIKRSLAAENKMSKDEAALRDTKVKKLGCKTDNATDYVCDIEIVSAHAAADGKTSHTISAPIVKVNNRWIYKESQEWCAVLMNKPTGQLTGNDLDYYGKCMSKKMN